MKQKTQKLLAGMLVVSLLIAALPGVSLAAQRPTVAAAAAQEAPSAALGAESLANATYESMLANGPVQLVDGQYEDTANKIIVVLAEQPRAYGALNGENAAAVLIGENGGGSGIFTSLAVVLEQDGAPVNVATALLGDRVNVFSLEIADDQIDLTMLTQGPNDPMCCPTQIVRQRYTLDGDTLTLAEQTTVGSVPQVTVENAPGGYTQTIVPATPFTADVPGGPTGAPAHVVLSFGDSDPVIAQENGEFTIAVYPVDAYVQLFQENGDLTIATAVAELQALLASQPEAPAPPLPILPPPVGQNDLAAQVKYIDGDSFTGVRFLGRTVLDVSPALNGQVRYHFQGLTDDGQYLVVASSNLATTALPSEAAADATVDLAADTATINASTDDQWTPSPSVLDTIVESVVIASGASSLTPEALYNMTYKSILAPEGEVTLVDGKYEDTANRISVALAPAPMAFGTINGQSAAAVLTAENGGGSGVFVNLALVLDQDGTPVNVALTTLGDRVNVTHLEITPAGYVAVDMVAQGPDDPMCCPTMPATVVYELFGQQLVPVAQVSATITPGDAAESVSATIIQPVPYDDTMPPGAQGQPKHPTWAFNGDDPATAMNENQGYAAIYNAAAFQQMWDAAGDPYVSNALAALEGYLTERPAQLEEEIAFVPMQPGVNDFTAQLGYVDLANGGAGMRWVTRFVQDASPVMNWQLRYAFQGLTADGRLISALIPVTTTVLPNSNEEVPADVQELVNTDYAAYQTQVVGELNGLAAADFTPSLDALDAMMASILVEQLSNTLTPAVLTNMTYQTDLLPAGEVTLVDGAYSEPAAPGSASMNQVTLLPSPIAYGVLNGNWSAAVLLAESGGGSGTFVNLAVVEDVNGAPTNTGVALLGDRVQVNNMAIVEEMIYIDMLVAGPEDPACCPSQAVQRVYAFQDGALQMVSETAAAPAGEATSAPAAGELTANPWVWQQTQMNDDSVRQPATPGAFVLTLADDGSAAATTDCNTFSGSYTTAGNQITISLPAATMMACPEGAQEQEFIADLTSVTSYLFAEGNLVLELPFDSGGMSFAAGE